MHNLSIYFYIKMTFFFILRSLYHEYKNVYKRKLYYEAKGIENGLTSLKCKIYDIEEKLELSSILIAREHAHAEVNVRTSYTKGG